MMHYFIHILGETITDHDIGEVEGSIAVAVIQVAIASFIMLICLQY